MLLRLGIRYSPELEDSWIKMIRNGQAAFVEHQSNRVSIYEIPVMVSGEDVPRRINVVYDSNRHSIVTVLYPEGPLI